MSHRHRTRVLTITFLFAFLLLAAQYAGRSAAAAGGPNISVNDASLTEADSGTSNMNFTISLDVADPANATTVSYTTADNTAAQPSDYTATSGTVTIPAGQTSFPLTVKVVGDKLNEANETFFVNLTGNPSNNATILDGSGTGTIINNDAAPKISIANAVVTEDLAGPGGMVFNVSLSAASGQPISVTYATSDGTATAGLDYTAAPPTVLTFAPGEISKQIAIPIVADSLNEFNETFNVNLTNPVIATLNNTKGVGTINDDDPIPTISIDNPSIFESNAGSSIMPFTVSLSAPSGKVVTVKYQTANGTATAPSDFTALPLTTLTFQPGVQSQNVNVSIKGDTINEADETFLINLSLPTNVTFASSQGVGTIRNDDAPPAISIGDITVAEPTSGSANATFVVSLSAASGQQVSVNYATADNGSATAGLDYVAQSGLITFNPGVTTQQISVPINSDQLVEPNETFLVNLTNPINASFADSQAIGTITSTAGVPIVSILDKTVTEGVDASAGFVVQLSAPNPQPVTVTYAVAGVTAVAGADFQIPAAPLSITFAPGITTQTIAVPILDDTLNEPSETFNVTLTGATGASIGSGVATGTIIDNDPPPTITINNVQVSDTGSTPNAIFTVSLSAPSSYPITVDYQTADGTATAGADYQAQSGKLTIPAGATSATITIPIIGDTVTEPNETFTVNLGNAVNATLATTTGTGTISDRPQTAPGNLVYVGIILR